MMFMRKEEPPLSLWDKVKIHFAVHWRGIITFLTPLILSPILFLSSPPKDALLMFIGSLILAAAVEQSGLHKRLAYAAIRFIGYSHIRLLSAISIVTCFVSMWITNAAATTMMVPITFAILRVFEKQKLVTIYEKDLDGNPLASDITTCYFCAASFSATIGGIGTLVGTATNLAFKGLLMTAYPQAPEDLSFPLFSAFGVPLMILLEIFMFLYFAIVYLGLFRPFSDTAKKLKMAPETIQAAKRAVVEDSKKLGKITFWEIMVIILFGGAIISFFCRSPQLFAGWGDAIINYHNLTDKKFVQDSAMASFVIFLMLFLPSTTTIFKNCTAKYHEDLSKGRIRSVLHWPILIADLPFSFAFLLGGGFALSGAANKSGFNTVIGQTLAGLSGLPNILVLFIIITVVVLVTNLASNVAVATVFCPIAMELASQLNKNPLWYCMAAGFSASFCFMLPVGTPGNLIIQSAANIPTPKMVKAGVGPTITTIIITWLLMSFWAPIIWSDLDVKPAWANNPAA
ncbi:protein I'm not dead yet-like isoform X2 [Leptidea sinapis]|uniref:protein I'm not dead yet-like isoform X2 n=1 Tax=Leptidea sinapis TaxID=189913 RepID=UPI00212EBFC9|nr:protein I'm not dead yet-like isoform X2 [Leptidea sinapis]